MFINDPETLRERLATTYGELLENPKLGPNAERSVYNWAVQIAQTRNIARRWNNEAFARLYLGKARAIHWNLANVPFLKEEIKAKRLKARDIGSLSHPEMFPEKWKPVIEEKIEVQHLLAFANLFIGGGGTLNSEACFLGTPTISTRSFISHYDKYQIDKGVMVWINNRDELIEKSLEMLNLKKSEKIENFLSEMEIDIEKLTNDILA